MKFGTVNFTIGKLTVDIFGIDEEANAINLKLTWKEEAHTGTAIIQVRNTWNGQRQYSADFNLSENQKPEPPEPDEPEIDYEEEEESEEDA